MPQSRPLTDAERQEWLKDIETQLRDGLITTKEADKLKRKVNAMPRKD